jgi:tellurite resistance protein TehA-like permease
MITVARLRELDLPPDAFAVVMATGIVSEAAKLNDYPIISTVTDAVAGVLFVVLAIGLALRIAVRPASARREVTDPDVAFRLFTAVAACAVLATRAAGRPWLVWLLGAAGLAAWMFLVPLAARDVRNRPRAELRDHVHGAWLLPSVATAGLAITAADVALDQRAAGWLVAGALAWLLAVAVYVAVAWLIAWRALASPFVPDEVTPDSWILMGALAIAGLASDHLLHAVEATGLLPWLSGPLHGTSLATWILASFWIPGLLYAEIWRADRTTGSLRFAGVWWSAVFPLGMYATATATTGHNLGLPQFATISLVFFWVAVTVWLMVALGAVHRAAARLAQGR